MLGGLLFLEEKFGERERKLGEEKGEKVSVITSSVF